MKQAAAKVPGGISRWAKIHHTRRRVRDGDGIMVGHRSRSTRCTAALLHTACMCIQRCIGSGPSNIAARHPSPTPSPLFSTSTVHCEPCEAAFAFPRSYDPSGLPLLSSRPLGPPLDRRTTAKLVFSSNSIPHTTSCSAELARQGIRHLIKACLLPPPSLRPSTPSRSVNLPQPHTLSLYLDVVFKSSPAKQVLLS